MISEAIWLERLATLQLDLYRVESLLEVEQIQRERDLSGKFTSELSKLTVALRELQLLDVAPNQRWQQLNNLIQKGQSEINVQLEILGGLAVEHGIKLNGSKAGFDRGFIPEAEKWINGLRGAIGLDRRLTVLAGRGPLLEANKGIVRIPFLDWDLWHLPLLGRALGLLAIVESKDYQTALSNVICPYLQQIEDLFEYTESPPPDLDKLLPQVRELWRKWRFITTDNGRNEYREFHQERLEQIREQQKQYLHAIFADMFATVILGPAYALAVFILELDYSSPDQLALADPDQIEGRSSAPRFLPSPVDRAAVILATLERMDNEKQRAHLKKRGPYTVIRHSIHQLWHEVLESAQKQDNLGKMQKRFAPWCKEMYHQVIRPLAFIEINKTETTWKAAQGLFEVLSEQGGSLKLKSTTTLVSTMWLYRLNFPYQANYLLDKVHSNPDNFIPLESQKAKPPLVVAQARLNRLANRCQRLEEILQEETFQEDGVVTGRFYRLISEQIYKLEWIEKGVQDNIVHRSLWSKLKELHPTTRLIQREALELIGGVLVLRSGLDREPESITQGVLGPNICTLADEILRGYTRRTGINWNARTILGRVPFLATSTDVIRIRFPDWGVWNLPLVAHEFGHIVAKSTPSFLKYQTKQAKQGISEVRIRHLEEIFADIFATYTFGPAFAYCAILGQFNPVEAFLPRGTHPTHAERVRIILDTLDQMNAATRTRRGQDGYYNAVRQKLVDIWDSLIFECQAEPKGIELVTYKELLEQSRRWGRKVYRDVDTYYRLGASYTLHQWKFAYQIAGMDNLDMHEIRREAQKHDIPRIDIIDILNGLWQARLQANNDLKDVTKLSSAANSIVLDYLRNQ